MSDATDQLGRTRWLRTGAVVTFLGAAVAITMVFVIGEQHLEAVRRACDLPRPQMPAAGLPLAVAATVLALMSAVLLVFSVRMSAVPRWTVWTSLFVTAAVLLTLFSAYFGIIAVLQEQSAGPLRCGG